MNMALSIPLGFDTAVLERQFAAIAREGDTAGAKTGAAFGAAFGKALEDLPEGMRRLRLQLETELSPTMEVLRDGGLQAISSLRSAFREFVRTGEVDFDRLVRSMAASLAMIAFDQFITDPLRELLRDLGNPGSSSSGGDSSGGLGSLISSGVSAFVSFLTGASNHALGGPVTFGRPYVVGERGRELFVPKTSGTIVPNGAMGGGQIVFNVTATDAQSFRRSETQIAAMLNRMVRRGQRNL